MLNLRRNIEKRRIENVLWLLRASDWLKIMDWGLYCEKEYMSKRK